jgi:hypothetical protein
MAPDVSRRVVEAYQAGATLVGIAMVEGVSRDAVTKVLHVAGVTLRPRGKPQTIDRAKVAAMRAAGMSWVEISAVVGSSPSALRKNGTRYKATKRRRVQVPGWVPRDLVDEYRDHAVQFGEEAAASMVRQLKRSAA